MEIKKIKPDTEYAWVKPGRGYWGRDRVTRVRIPEKVILGYRGAKGVWTDEVQHDEDTGIDQRKLFVKVEVFDGTSWDEFHKAIPTRQLHVMTDNMDRHLTQTYVQAIEDRKKREARAADEAKIDELLELLLTRRGVSTPADIKDALRNVKWDEPGYAIDWLEAIVR